MQTVDVAIIGGGMVGLATAALLSKAGLNVCVVNNGTIQKSLSAVADPRVSALNVQSQAMLEAIGAWSTVDVDRICAYQHMDVWEQDSFARIDFSASHTGRDELGYIVENQNVINGLALLVKTDANIQLYENATFMKMDINDSMTLVHLSTGDVICAQLVIGADGPQSPVRRACKFPLTHWSYDQSAIVATVETQSPHDETARQVFTAFGPLAFLPLHDPHHCSIVWSQDTDKAKELMAMDETTFNRSLSATFDMRLGHCKILTKRVCIPLTMRYAKQWVSDRCVIIGDAAHTIHPLAGQGVNLGFQDAIALSETLSVMDNSDIGNKGALRTFERERKAAAAKMIATMEGFKQLFAGSHPLKKFVRGTGMALVNRATPIKQQLIAQAMGIRQ